MYNSCPFMVSLLENMSSILAVVDETLETQFKCKHTQPCHLPLQPAFRWGAVPTAEITLCGAWRVFFLGEYKSLFYIVEGSEQRRPARFLGCERPPSTTTTTLSFHVTTEERDMLCFKLFVVGGQMPEGLLQGKLKRGLFAV